MQCTNKDIYNQVTKIGVGLVLLITYLWVVMLIEMQDNSIDHKFAVYYEYDIIQGDTIPCDTIKEIIY